jgi:hypothetical protein
VPEDTEEPADDRVANVDHAAQPNLHNGATSADGGEEAPVDLPSIAGDPPRYRVTDLAGIRAEPERFFDFTYRVTLRSMVEAVLTCEAPIKEDILFQRIARAHGWLRVGGRIRKCIAQHLRDVERSEETSGVFLWRKGTLAERIPYRQPLDAGSGRAIADIPLAELAAFVADNLDIVDEPDPALALARRLGLGRLTAPTRARLDEALSRGRHRGASGSDDPAALKA